jgi:hypothetical protein
MVEGSQKALKGYAFGLKQMQASSALQPFFSR